MEKGAPDTGKELNRSLACLSTKLRLTEGNVLESVCKALALGLVSFSVSHVNRFDTELLEIPVHGFDIGPGTAFRLRSLACLRDSCGPAWVLGSATSTAELKLSIDVNDFNFIWGPMWLIDSAIRTRKGGFIMAVGDVQEREIECHMLRELLPSRVPTSFTPSTRLLIAAIQASTIQIGTVRPRLQAFELK